MLYKLKRDLQRYFPSSDHEIARPEKFNKFMMNHAELRIYIYYNTACISDEKEKKTVIFSLKRRGTSNPHYAIV